VPEDLVSFRHLIVKTLTANRESVKHRRELANATDAEMENLCIELKKKARCSESGPVIDQKDIDAAIERQMTGLSPAH
jgi:hypothetical protein